MNQEIEKGLPAGEQVESCVRWPVGVGRHLGERSGRMRNLFALLLASLLVASGAGWAGAEGPAAPVRVELNRATSAELETLPGIGAVKAAAILAVRDAQGGFRSLDELENVRGIGPALMAKLRPLVVLGKAPGKSGSVAAGKVAQTPGQ